MAAQICESCRRKNDASCYCSPNSICEMYEEEEMMKFMKAMISQPMAGKTNEQISATREKAVKAMESMGYEVVNTFFCDEFSKQEHLKDEGVVCTPVYFLAKAIAGMSMCHAVYFCEGWQHFRGCKIEHEVAEKYGLTIIYESGDQYDADTTH